MLSDIMKDMQDRSDKSIENVKKEFSHIRTGRANVSVLDDVRIEHYGQQMPINQLATLSVPEPRMILISAWDQTAVPAIEKGIQKANLGLSLSNDGKVIRVTFPELTEERRKEFVKLAHSKAEEGRIAVRNIRRDANDHIKTMLKNHEVSEDEEKRALDKVQNITDEAIKSINHHLDVKEKEIMEI